MAAAGAGGDTSPEVEFTFLRPMHQPRTLARPASSYLSNPTSPTPPSRPTSPPPVPVAVPSASQQRALSPKPMRNGAPRLGGLGLGGIAPPEPPPHFRSPSLPRPAPTPPPRPTSAAPPPLPERRPASPATFAPSASAVTTRPFLSPELDKPTVRTGAFALDTHAAPDQVLPGPRSRDVTPEGAKGVAARAAAPAEPVASSARPADVPARAEAVEDDSEDELEQAPHEPEWLQPSPQAERSLDSLAFAPVVEPTRDVEADRFVAGDPTSLLGAVATASSRSAVDVGPAGPAESDDSDDEDGDFDDARSSAPSLAASADDAPVVSVVDDDAHAQSVAVAVPEEDEPEEDEEVVLDGPSSVSPASSRPGSTFEAPAPADDEPAPAPLDVLRSDERAQPQHVAVALLARAERSSSSAGSHGGDGVDDTATDDHVDDESVAVSSPALSRSTSFAGSLASEYSSHEPVVNSHPPPSSQLDEPTSTSLDLAANPPFAPTSQVELARDESVGEKEDQRDAAAVYPSPPSSPSYSPAPERVSSTTSAPVAPTSDLSEPVESAPAAAPAPIDKSPSSSSSTAPSSQQTSRPATLPASPSFNSYAGLGLRLPSSLGRNKRSSFVPPASPPVSPETAEQGLPTLVVSDASAAQSNVGAASSSSPRSDDAKEAASVKDELSAPTVPVATSPIARDYAHLPPEPNTPTTADNNELGVDSSPTAAAEPEAAPTPRPRREAELPALDEEPAVFSSADILAAPVFGDDDEFTPASSASNSPALTARTAGSDFADVNDVPEAPLAAPAHDERRALDAASPSAVVEEPAGPSGPGVVDVGVAVAGAIVMGGLAVGTSALRGLAGWAWRSEPAAASAPAAQAAAPVARVEPPAQADVPAEEQKVPGGTETARSVSSSERAESSVVSTDWGEMEFDAPEGFLDEFKQAMQEIGVAELEAEDLAAQQAAYLAASRQHDEALEGEPRPEPTSSSGESTPAGSVRTVVFPSAAPRSSRPSSISGGSVRSARRQQRPLTPADEGDEMDELDRMLAPVWDGRGYVQERRASPAASVARAAPVAPASPTKYGYAAPPGLAGSTPLSRTLSPPSSALSRSTSSISSSLSSRAPPTAKQQQQSSPSRFGRSLFALGSSSKEPKSPKGAKLKKGRPEHGSSAAPPSPLKAQSPKVASPQSAKSLSSIDEDGRSAYTSASHKPPSRRRSFVSFGGSTIGSGGGSAAPVTSIESRIADTTYVHYGSSAPKAKRRESAASIAADLYASRDPVLIPGVPASPSAFTSLLPPQPESSPPRRRSSLRSPQAESKLARVRFANATRGLGLRSVAEDEAERGGDDVALKWIGVGRGRYGNLTIKEGEEMDILYDDQVKSIKGKWRSFGSEQSRDWSNVRID
ncbi:uncharacterized protein RHOBADRAFT_52780 [Rhodotorula graminis WP1]|uniref:Proteophosphoglycan ppg4 n=1 Tax=Rhodotorula graminis (strain WP1) TaxID=578459 RepID=A0A194S5G1_RHOGW|nr:uncharacterized protein RHOBADRAFT_52780 [Rhodotorula graminis WP1]KPV75750.1 hypothetical protein RHOBADRAFT_52780 [Rhodotorula graminis WP1]